MQGPWRRVAERQPEHVAAHRPLGLELGVGLRGHGEVALAAEIERLERRS